MRKPATSESMCAASVRIARDPEIQPPITSTTIKKKQIATTITSLLNALFASSCFCLNFLSFCRKQGLEVISLSALGYYGLFCFLTTSSITDSSPSTVSSFSWSWLPAMPDLDVCCSRSESGSRPGLSRSEKFYSI